MPIIDLYKHGEGRSNLAHFAAMASLAALDGIITGEEKDILDYFAEKLGITEAEYREVMKDDNKYPIEAPLSHKERLERLFDFFRVVASDRDIAEAQVHMVEVYAVAMGFSPEKARKVVSRSFDIFTGNIALEDYIYLIEK